ncbi:hypothetical protein QR665_17230 [Acinetobacter gerneri]|uniref:hypothetical protein n=1 Tax=Acinetobacter gerneri TaxID=202952 RepID=UPI00293581C0|nr:hypothetical protein [Acinetobacter gerneri]MDV2441190.1 hypothetical protein [Acinetobacter gerneri]
MKLDRSLQKEILNVAAENYPSPIFSELYPIEQIVGEDLLVANLKYLEQHNLIEKNSIARSLDGIYSINQVTIIHHGMDFLADDGGLSAILGVVTIKFEADQLKLLLESKIMATDLPPADKHKLIDGLRSLSAESIKHLTTKIVDLGWDNLGTLVRIIQSSLS